MWARFFYVDKTIVGYNNLGIGRLNSIQLPMPLCEMFMKEVFGGKLPDILDDETLNTINKFFDNSLKHFRDFQTAVPSQKYPGIPSGKDPEKHRTGYPGI